MIVSEIVCKNILRQSGDHDGITDVCNSYVQIYLKQTGFEVAFLSFHLFSEQTTTHAEINYGVSWVLDTLTQM